MTLDINHSCIACKHFYLEYEGDYSEQTPGIGLMLGCYQGHFRVYGGKVTLDTLREAHERGQTCLDFESEASE